MERRTVELRIGGQKYRVVSSADDAELQRLAGMVSSKLSELSSGAVVAPQAMLLAALALAHDAETERRRRESVEGRTRELLQRLLVRIDASLGACDVVDDAGGT